MDGLHLGIGGVTASDVFQVSSFRAYETDIAIPIKVGLLTAGHIGSLLFSTANCNLNGHFFLTFLLKMQKEWRIAPEN